MGIKRKILIAVLGLGTVLGYAHGFSSMRRCHKSRHERFEQHVASVCVDAARRGDDAPGGRQGHRGHHGRHGWGHHGWGQQADAQASPDLRDPFAPPPAAPAPEPKLAGTTAIVKSAPSGKCPPVLTRRRARFV